MAWDLESAGVFSKKPRPKRIRLDRYFLTRLAFGAERQPLAVNPFWMIFLAAATLVFLVVCGTLLWKRTRFS